LIVETLETPHPIAKTLKHSFRLFLIDLEALPEEAYTKEFGPKVRTISDIVHEVNVVNDEIVKVIQGGYEEPMPSKGWVRASESLRTKAATIEAFKKSSEAALAVVGGLTAEDMAVTVKNQEGEATREQECRFMNIHVWYHLGQLNYVQTLFGDDTWHWMS
jgi:uncharacterized damage-inducible protein DinB